MKESKEREYGLILLRKAVEACEKWYLTTQHASSYIKDDDGGHMYPKIYLLRTCFVVQDVQLMVRFRCFVYSSRKKDVPDVKRYTFSLEDPFGVLLCGKNVLIAVYDLHDEQFSEVAQLFEQTRNKPVDDTLRPKVSKQYVVRNLVDFVLDPKKNKAAFLTDDLSVEANELLPTQNQKEELLTELLRKLKDENTRTWNTVERTNTKWEDRDAGLSSRFRSFVTRVNVNSEVGVYGFRFVRRELVCRDDPETNPETKGYRLECLMVYGNYFHVSRKIAKIWISKEHSLFHEVEKLFNEMCERTYVAKGIPFDAEGDSTNQNFDLPRPAQRTYGYIKTLLFGPQEKPSQDKQT
jgi:hypothetical protein